MGNKLERKITLETSKIEKLLKSCPVPRAGRGGERYSSKCLTRDNIKEIYQGTLNWRKKAYVRDHLSQCNGCRVDIKIYGT